LPPDEEARLNALRRYEVLDTEPEQEFDDITLLASHICGTPVAMITLVDEDRQWLKSKIAVSWSETSRDIAFCAHGILQTGVFVVRDALADARFAGNPLVTGTPAIRFYAGAPLRTADGHALGMLCVTDEVPRELSPEQTGALQALSRQVVAQLELRRSTAALRRSEESLRLLASAVEQSKESIVITDADLDPPGPRILFVNPAFTRMTGYTAQEALGKTPRILQGPRTDKAVLSRLRQNLERGELFEGETINYRKGGAEFEVEWQIAPISDAGVKITHFISVQRDITERKRLEARLFQSQKMETVGKLAGGIAHEFNSILTAIIGQGELLLGDLPAASPLSGSATEIVKAANRAASLTRQLLAYGRKQILRPESLDLNRVIAGMEGMFHHLMGDAVSTCIVPAPDLRMVKADAGQIEQVIMNMAINAHDAMPNGGLLTLETANVSVDQESIGRYPELKPGEYVMLAITDTGMGMTPEVKAHLFEPFFSTKNVGQGTGLGLSTCHGIIKQSGGQISVYSEPARGATFKIYLPQVELEAKMPVRRLESPDLPRGDETILLVEDDPALREMAATLLRRLGYTVLAAGNGIEALGLKHQRSTGHIDLLFTDVVMPHMSGKELAERIQASYPHTRTLFTSAYTENAIVHQGVLNEGVALLQKPFTPAALAHKVRELLDCPPPMRSQAGFTSIEGMGAPGRLIPAAASPLPL
jgi:PAS domain S-box-containing protein